MQNISLIIPTHNRHSYLDRVLEYYRYCSLKIVIADSTSVPYVFKNNISDCKYLHLPGKSFTEKLSITFQLIETPLMVMCADDDFTFIGGIQSCAEFLLENTSYVAVMGNCICYRKDSVNDGKVQFAAMYTDRITFKTLQEDPFERLHAYFRNYRSMFYAVHRTEVLRQAFTGADAVVTNLFLNEYLTVILPLIKGKAAELPVLYQVREYAADSGDKTIMNLDNIMEEESHLPAYHQFIEYESSVMARATGKEIGFCRNQLNQVLTDYATYLKSLKHSKERDAVQSIGSVIRKLPVVGKKIIQLYRSSKENKRLKLFIRTAADKSEIKIVYDLILKYKYATNP